jgi:hypothetical protein
VFTNGLLGLVFGLVVSLAWRGLIVCGFWVKSSFYRLQHSAEEHEILPHLLRFYLGGWLGFRFVVPRGVDVEGKFAARFGRLEEVG